MFIFENSGHKIKGLASFLFAIVVLYSVVLSLIYIIKYDNYLFGFLTLILGPLMTYVCCLLLYGFGELIVNIGETSDNTCELLTTNERYKENCQKEYIPNEE